MREIEKIAVRIIAEDKEAERVDKVVMKIHTLKQLRKDSKVLETEKADFCKKARQEQIDEEVALINKRIEMLLGQIEVIEDNAERDAE